MKVSIIIGAQHAYACIKTEKRSLDVLLEHGKAPKQSLVNSAYEMREKAIRMLNTAKLIEEAAEVYRA